MSPESRAKDFATWLILHTQKGDAMGPSRIYKGRTLNVDELYDAWYEFKKETNTKY
jgi:hypothetical protein